MAGGKLPGDATIAGVRSTLVESESYLWEVLGRMYSYKKTPGPAYVQIGTLGEGKFPNYRVASAEALEQPEGNDGFDAYSGRSHKPLPFESQELANEHWSTARMSIAEVQDLLRTVIKQG